MGAAKRGLGAAIAVFFTLPLMNATAGALLVAAGEPVFAAFYLGAGLVPLLLVAAGGYLVCRLCRGFSIPALAVNAALLVLATVLGAAGVALPDVAVYAMLLAELAATVAGVALGWAEARRREAAARSEAALAQF